MANALLHKVEVEDRRLVETASALIEALNDFDMTKGKGDQNLAETMVVELLIERLSDGSSTYEIRIRVAEAV